MDMFGVAATSNMSILLALLATAWIQYKTSRINQLPRL